MSDKTSHDSASNNDALENGHSHKQPSDHGSQRHRLPFSQWAVEKVTWSWFTCTQSTGGISALLSKCPKRFEGLATIGTIIFIFNLVLFLIFSCLTLLRWRYDPKRFAKSFLTPPDSYFFGSFWLTTATIIIDIDAYGVPSCGPWLVTVVRVLFWMYAAITLVNVSVHMSLVFRQKGMKGNDFKAPAFLCILNAMLTGTVAATIVQNQVCSRVAISSLISC
jgi:tellurite resistance protein TehA-like permease